MTQHDREPLLELVSQLASGTLDADGIAQLQELLADDLGAQDLYADYMHLHVGIKYWSGKEKEESSQLLSVVSQPVGHAPRDENDPTDSAREACPTRSKSWLDRASKRPVRPALAIAALVMISIVAWMGVATVKTQLAGGGKNTDESRETKKPDFVAWYMGAHNAKWLDNTEPEKTRLDIGQRLAIAKGLIEIQYITGAVVVIEGPAEFYVGGKHKSGNGKAESGKAVHPSSFSLQPSNSGYLAHGSLVARVAGEKAKGFTVDTPNGSVEDLGTEFGVSIRQGGATFVAVLQGKVRVDSTGLAGSIARVTLAKGEVVEMRRGAGGTGVTYLKGASRSQFVGTLPRALPTWSDNLVLNPIFQFTATGHTDGDDSGHTSGGSANISDWSGTGSSSDPQSIFNFTHEYFQVQTNGTVNLYQHVTVTAGGNTELSMVAAHRNDSANNNGSLFLELYTGHLASFGSGLITPDATVAPALIAALQTYSNTYNSLASGNYTVRVGGTDGGAASNPPYQAGISRMQLVVEPVVEQRERETNDDHDKVGGGHKSDTEQEERAMPRRESKPAIELL